MKLQSLTLRLSVPVLCLLFCGTYLLATNGMNKAILRYPYALIGGLVVLSLWTLIDELRRKNTKTEEETEVPPRNIVILVAATGLYLVLIPIVGYFVTTLAFTAGLMFWQGVRKPLPLTLIPIGFCGVQYLIFQVLLYLPIPRGFLM